MDAQRFDPKSAAGEVLGGCLLVELIGKGAMGAVYEARQVSLDRRVAVKVHQIADDADTDVRGKLFMNEARLVARVNHPNIVQIFDIGRQRDLLYMIMEYVEGVTLEDILAKQGRLPVDMLYGVTRKVACGLAAAHNENIVHGDIKSQNVLLTSHGEMKIADFWAASFLLADSGERKTLVGTPLYMAPEIIAREPNSGRADVYALGLILYTAASGAHPFHSSDVRSILRSQLESPVPPLAERSSGLPQGFTDVIDGLVSKEPHERPSSKELLDVLERHPEWEGCQVAHDEPVVSTPHRPGSFRVKISGSTGGSSKVRELCIQARFHVMKRQWDRAEICFRRALEVDPDCEAALLGLARLQIEQNDHDDAVATLERALGRGTIDPIKILESKHFEPLKAHKEFRQLMASLTL